MQAKKITDKTRLYLGDMNKAKYSDWEIFNGINDALRVLADESAKNKGALFRDRETITISSLNAALLPERFISCIKAFDSSGAELFNVHNDDPAAGEFSINGINIMSGEASLVLWYFKYPDQISGFESEIDMPESMIVPIAKVAASSIKQDDTQMVNMARYALGLSTEDSGK